MTCVECGAMDVEVKSGRELYIKAMEVDVETRDPEEE
jgi:Zn finger protein HypA/HybF involved in hydrogenase expression